MHPGRYVTYAAAANENHTTHFPQTLPLIGSRQHLFMTLILVERKKDDFVGGGGVSNMQIYIYTIRDWTKTLEVPIVEMDFGGCRIFSLLARERERRSSLHV